MSCIELNQTEILCSEKLQKLNITEAAAQHG